jgi:hypothetical protein
MPALEPASAARNSSTACWIPGLFGEPKSSTTTPPGDSLDTQNASPSRVGRYRSMSRWTSPYRSCSSVGATAENAPLWTVASEVRQVLPHPFVAHVAEAAGAVVLLVLHRDRLRRMPLERLPQDPERS